MIKPNESDYTSHVAYTRALEAYCEGIEQERDALKTHNTMLRVCLQNVIKVADRKTDEFDAAKAALKREHVTDDSPCWCCPEVNYTDPDTGVSVIVHKEPQ